MNPGAHLKLYKQKGPLFTVHSSRMERLFTLAAGLGWNDGNASAHNRAGINLSINPCPIFERIDWVRPYEWPFFYFVDEQWLTIRRWGAMYPNCDGEPGELTSKLPRRYCLVESELQTVQFIFITSTLVDNTGFPATANGWLFVDGDLSSDRLLVSNTSVCSITATGYGSKPVQITSFAFTSGPHNSKAEADKFKTKAFFPDRIGISGTDVGP